MHQKFLKFKKYSTGCLWVGLISKQTNSLMTQRIGKTTNNESIFTDFKKRILHHRPLVRSSQRRPKKSWTTLILLFFPYSYSWWIGKICTVLEDFITCNDLLSTQLTNIHFYEKLIWKLVEVLKNCFLIILLHNTFFLY